MFMEDKIDTCTCSSRLRRVFGIFFGSGCTSKSRRLSQGALISSKSLQATDGEGFGIVFSWAYTKARDTHPTTRRLFLHIPCPPLRWSKVHQILSTCELVSDLRTLKMQLSFHECGPTIHFPSTVAVRPLRSRNETDFAQECKDLDRSREWHRGRARGYFD